MESTVAWNPEDQKASEINLVLPLLGGDLD